MSHDLQTAVSGSSLVVANGDASPILVTLSIAGQLFGIPVLQVQDVLGPQKITPVPLAPPEILGSLNLRGRIVTAVDVRIWLGLPPRGAGEPSMSIVVDHEDELYSLVVDKVGDVMNLSPEDYEKNPATLDTRWQEISSGIYRLKTGLLVVLDITRLLQLSQSLS